MADTNLKTNRHVLRGLLAIQNRLIDLEFQLRVDGKTDEANQLGLSIDNLGSLIRDLRGKILDDWVAKVPDLRKKLTKMNSDVQETVDDIENDIETAQRVVSLIGKVDEAVSLLGPLLM
jgi:gas vesicle protein